MSLCVSVCQSLLVAFTRRIREMWKFWCVRAKKSREILFYLAAVTGESDVYPCEVHVYQCLDLYMECLETSVCLSVCVWVCVSVCVCVWDS